MRLVKTSRHFGCVQIGRVVDGKLGVLGRDGAFANDGKFHERGAGIIQQTDCQLADGAGHLFIAMSYIGLPDSADATSCVPRPEPSLRRADCSRASLRNIYYGLLGPAAKAVTYIGPRGALVREPVTAPDGAYLVVVRTNPHRPNVGYFSPGVTPRTGLRSVEYRDGTVCHIVSARRVGGARDCPLKGYVAPKLPRVTRADLVTKIHVDIGTRPEHPGPKPKLLKGAPQIPAERRVIVSFRARRPADTRSFYTISTRMLHYKQGCSYGSVGAIAKNVTAGTVVRQTLYFAYKCANTLRIDVGYAQQRRPTDLPYDVAGFGNAKVGRVTVTLP
jgi:hypothetical protein